MKIAIRQPRGPNLRIWLPNRLILNPLAFQIYQRMKKKEDPEDWLAQLSPEAVKALCKELRRHKKLCLIDVQSADGESVKIVL